MVRIIVVKFLDGKYEILIGGSHHVIYERAVRSEEYQRVRLSLIVELEHIKRIRLELLDNVVNIIFNWVV